MSDKAPWITYRPELKVLDCTVRDGGLMNDHQFDDTFVKAVYQTCIDAGIDYMEIGYKNSDKQFSRDQFGAWKFCDEEDMRRVVGGHDADNTGLKLTAMADAGKSDWKTQIIPADQSVLSMIRVACYVHQIPEAIDMLHHCHEMGYETACNIMAISGVQEPEIDQALEVLAPTPAQVIVIVDSFGSLYREQIDYLYRKYEKALEGTGKEIGIHAHNNMQLAFANTIEAIILGCNRADSTLDGFGRGAGNCPTELLIGFLKNPKFKLKPIIDMLQQHVLPLKKNVDWGPNIAYNLTGKYNRHPRSAMQWLAGETPEDYTAFYDQFVSDI